jgi:AraC family transcriptional regulator
VIYRQMPAVWDTAFRRKFYASWGRESAIISAHARSAEYPEYRQLLSIKAAFGGCEDYFIDGRRVSVDDDTFLILNEGRSYGSRIDSLRPVHSFSIFFDAQLSAQVRDSIASTDEQLLDRDAADHSFPNVEFAERLYHHDRAVSPGLRYICAAVDSGLQDDHWIDEQLVFLLGRMLKSHYNGLKLESRISSVKRSTRRELLYRMNLGIDFIYTRYRDPIGLREIAASARLSPYHFLRTFTSVRGITPREFLNRVRAAKALRLLQNTTLSVNAIAQAVGFGSRTSLFRHMCAIYHEPPQMLRGKHAG